MRLHGTPVIRTRRLLLRRYCASDAQAAFALWSKDVWDERLTGFAPHESVRDTQRLIQRWTDAYQSDNVLRWAICTESGWIGDIAVTRWQPAHHSCELAFSLIFAARRQGYMAEALCAVARYLMETAGFHRVELKIFPENLPSCRLAERAGFRLEGTLRGAFRRTDGSYADVRLYARTNED